MDLIGNFDLFCGASRAYLLLFSISSCFHVGLPISLPLRWRPPPDTVTM